MSSEGDEDYLEGFDPRTPLRWSDVLNHGFTLTCDGFIEILTCVRPFLDVAIRSPAGYAIGTPEAPCPDKKRFRTNSITRCLMHIFWGRIGKDSFENELRGSHAAMAAEKVDEAMSSRSSGIDIEILPFDPDKNQMVAPATRVTSATTVATSKQQINFEDSEIRLPRVGHEPRDRSMHFQGQEDVGPPSGPVAIQTIPLARATASEEPVAVRKVVTHVGAADELSQRSHQRMIDLQGNEDLDSPASIATCKTDPATITTVPADDLDAMQTRPSTKNPLQMDPTEKSNHNQGWRLASLQDLHRLGLGRHRSGSWECGSFAFIIGGVGMERFCKFCLKWEVGSEMWEVVDVGGSLQMIYKVYPPARNGALLVVPADDLTDWNSTIVKQGALV